MKSIFEEMGGTYRWVGDYRIPNLEVESHTGHQLGKFGRLRRDYLKEHRSVLYTELVLDDKLFDHLAEIDRSCKERLELLIPAMAKQEGITEELKSTDQMAWVEAMNNIRSRAEEIVLHELVYT